MRDAAMKRFFQKLWDSISDPALKLPLTVAALFLTLVLAGLLLASGWTEQAAGVPAEIVLGPGDGQSEPESAEQSTMPGQVLPPVPSPEPDESESGWTSQGGKEYYLLEDGSFAVGLQRIGGKLYYFDENGVKAKALGVDVSYYDSDIDWELVKAMGVDFAIIRVGGRGWTSGVLYDDCRTQEYLRRARAAGLRIGVYFYSTAVNPREAVEEARAALKALGGIPLELPVFIDMEYSGEYPKGRADKLSPDERAEIAMAFCETIRNSGYQPGIYAGQNYMKAAIDYYVISRYTVWLASYTVNDRLPNFSRRYDLWQFTDRGRVDGIAGPVDLNVIF